MPTMRAPVCMLMILAAPLWASCSKDTPCVVCYEDEWSREPFPGQAKQHIKPLTPEDIKANGGMPPAVHVAEPEGIPLP